MNQPLSAAVGTLLLIALAACGGSDTGASGSTDGKKIVASMATALAPVDGMLSSADATCVATKFVDKRGTAALVKAKVVDSTFGYALNGANVDAVDSAAYAAALLSCVDEKTVLSAVRKSLLSAYSTSSSTLPASDAGCLVTAYTKDAGVAGLLAAHVISDTGAFNTQRPAYDKASATVFANAVLGCLDALKSKAQAAATANPRINEAALEACLKRAIPTSFLRDSFLVNQLTGQDEAAATAEVAINRRTAACEKATTKK